MFAAKISSVLAGGILVLGSSAIALAQAGPPEELPNDEVQDLQLQNETATNAVENQGENGDVGTERHNEEHGDATEFSDWVKTLGEDLEGCKRGLTIAATAQNGPLNFETDGPQDVPHDHPAIAAGCADENQNGFSGDNLPEDEERGAEVGRQTAEENSGDAAEFENEDEDAGPPSDPGPPSEAGASGDGGPPSDAGSRGGR